MRRLWPDVRYGVRMLFRYPTLSLASVLTFGLGIGPTTTAFSIVNGALYKGLPFENADRLVAVVGVDPARNEQRPPLAVQDLAVWRERQSVFQSSGEYSVTAINLSTEDEQPGRYSAGQLTVGAFDALGVEPALGRGFRAGEDQAGADPVILIGYQVWRDMFGASPDVLGRTVRVSGTTRTIIGVMPDGFGFPAFEHVWIPLSVDPLATPRGQGPEYNFVGLLEPGVSVDEAQAQATTVFAELEKEYPTTNEGLGALVMPYTEQFLGPELSALFYTMLAAAVGVLLIACVNVSNLVLARASLRQREVAIRLAIGASRGRVVVQMLTEVVVLAAGGAALGMLLSVAAMQWFLGLIAVNPPPFWISFESDHRVMLFVIGITGGASLFAGALPALQATGANLAAAVKDDSRGSTGLRIGRLSGGLVIAEVAVSCALLIAAGLLIRSVAEVRHALVPFAVDDVLTARINLPQSDYPDAAACIRFYEALLPRLQAVAGAEAAALADNPPAEGHRALPVAVEGQTYVTDRDYPVVREGLVTPGYFETFQAPLLQGRPFTPADRADAERVAIVNESFARAHVSDGQALGRRIRPDPGTRTDNPWRTIVGVVPDLLMEGIGNLGQSTAGYYIPIAQSDATKSVSIGVRARGEPASLATSIRSAVAELDPHLAVYEVRTMNEVISRRTALYAVFGTFFTAFGCIALLLAVAGLYGVMSFAVTQRTREMGIRTALGAKGLQLVRLVMARSTFQLGAGLAFGLGLGLLAAGSMQPLFYGVGPRDPLVLTVVPVALAAAGLLASFLPARRAARVDPVTALAAE